MTLSAYHTTVDERNEAREVFKMIFSQPKNIVRVLVDTLECPEKAKEPKKSKDRKTQAQRSILELDFSDPTELLLTVKKELLEVAQKYGKDRKTEFVDDFGEVCDEDLIPNEDVVIIRTHLGYMKRLSVDAFSQQKRGVFLKHLNYQQL